MKKFTWIIMTLLISIVVLTACGKDNVDTNSLEANDEESNEDSTTNDNQSSGTSVKGDIPDQLDLSIGDTGTFVTVLGSYDMTLNKATLVDDEIEDEKSTLDLFIILDLTIKNIGDENLNLEDVILSMEITSNLEHTGATDHAHGFDKLEAFEGELEPGKEMSAQFMTIVDDTEQYYFRKMVGNIASGSSNQVIWSFSSDEAK